MSSFPRDGAIRSRSRRDSNPLKLNLPTNAKPVKSRKSSLITAIALGGFAALLPATLSAATVLFSDDFSGGTGNLNGTAPDTRPGTESWISASQGSTPLFLANGAFTGGSTSTTGGTATLAFTPEQGKVYTLDATLSFTVGSSGSWLGLGFAKGQNVTASASNRFSSPTGDVIGRAWSFFRNNTNNPNAAMDGTNSTAVWTTLFPETSGNTQTIDLRVVLDTSAGAGNWTATWYARQTGDPSYIAVRATADLVTEDIDSVGFAMSGSGMSGTVDNFSLTVVPEPSAMLLGALGLLGLLRRRR